MKRIASLAMGLCLTAAGCAASAEPAAQAAQPAKKRRGFAVAKVERPKHFPHRIWAFSGFEARPANFGWFGRAETANIPKYPGNAAARRGTALKKGAALKTGMNPVPGPRMGKVNKLSVRYYLKGTDTVRFQHYSLSSGDNCNMLVSGLVQGKWSETVLNFTADSRRNDGSPGAFKEGERMDDLQVYAGKAGDGKTYEVVIDDAIFFAEDPALPPEPEPFPRRVMFLAAFDTGIDAKSKPKYFPGQFEPVSGAKAPKGSYWVVAKATPAGGKGVGVRLEMKPPRPVGPNTKLRFRCWLKGASKIDVVLHDASGGKDHAVVVSPARQGQWVTQYVTFSRGEKAAGGGKLPIGSKVDSVAFTAAGAAELCVDEVILFDAGRARRR